MEKVEVALAANHAYFPGLLVTAASLAEHTSHPLRLWILDGGLERQDRETLVSCVAAHHRSADVRFVEVSEASFDGFPEWNAGSRLTYARLMLPSLLRDVSLVIYSDVDFLWRADVGELWDCVRAEQKDGSPNAIWACLDPWVLTLEREGNPSGYVCAGMMVMDLEAWRQQKLDRGCMEYIRTHEVPFVDQSAINRVVANKGILPRKWGRFSREITRRELSGAWAIHYAGGVPWRWNYVLALITPADLEWYRYYGKLTGKSAWQVKVGFLGLKNYLLRRVAWILVHTQGLRQLFFAYLHLRGRDSYVRYFQEERV